MNSDIKSDATVFAAFLSFANIRLEFLPFLLETVLSFPCSGNDKFLVMIENMSLSTAGYKIVSFRPLKLISVNRRSLKQRSDGIA
jgi:hypothetical protein